MQWRSSWSDIRLHLCLDRYAFRVPDFSRGDINVSASLFPSKEIDAVKEP